MDRRHEPFVELKRPQKLLSICSIQSIVLHSKIAILPIWPPGPMEETSLTFTEDRRGFGGRVDFSRGIAFDVLEFCIFFILRVFVSNFSCIFLCKRLTIICPKVWKAERRHNIMFSVRVKWRDQLKPNWKHHGIPWAKGEPYEAVKDCDFWTVETSRYRLKCTYP